MAYIKYRTIPYNHSNVQCNIIFYIDADTLSSIEKTVLKILAELKQDFWLPSCILAHFGHVANVLKMGD